MFWASGAVHDDSDFSRLTTGVKGYVQTSDDDDRLVALQSLGREGQLNWLQTLQTAGIWAIVVESLHDEILRFSLNAALDMLSP